jgi:Protein of unknown function (DUF3301)
MAEFFALLAIVASVAFLYDNLRSKELASQYGRRYCLRHNLQFLDETVARRKLKFSRSESGRLAFVRYYDFEFCSDGSRRYKGKLEVRGNWVGNIELEPYVDLRTDAEDNAPLVSDDKTAATLISRDNANKE